MDLQLPLAERAARHAALGDPVRLAIVDELRTSDRASVELRRLFGLESNLLAHHLEVLEQVDLIGRSRSHGDARRRYVHLNRGALDGLLQGRAVTPAPALFVCRANSARSQLAAALWRRHTGQSASSAGTHPAPRVHPGAVAAAERAGLDLRDAVPRQLDGTAAEVPLVITVCDEVHEDIAAGEHWLHWSVADPVPADSHSAVDPAAFDATVAELTERIRAVTSAP